MLRDGDRLLFIGDSITDCGRSRPLGEGGGLGNGYVSLIDAHLTVNAPERKVRVLNTGSGGDTVRSLSARWQTDAIDLRADVLSVMIGINDVWRQFDSPNPEAGVPLSEYEDTLNLLLEQARQGVRSVLLATPFYIESNPDDAMRATMDRYSDVVRRIADQNGYHLVDTQAAFDAITAHRYAAGLAWDRVHPNLAGHLAIARAFLSVLGERVL
ncbi:GDSL family lipase [bacterium]|nr:MAG: GDSL family lipase [bacterium]